MEIFADADQIPTKLCLRHAENSLSRTWQPGLRLKCGKTQNDVEWWKRWKPTQHRTPPNIINLVAVSVCGVLWV